MTTGKTNDGVARAGNAMAPGGMKPAGMKPGVLNRRRRAGLAMAAGVLALAQAVPALADGATAPADPAAENAGGADQSFALHAQATVTTQGDFAFRNPYSGTNSLQPGQVKETVDATLYFGVRPWKGAELWLNPEVDQGFGLSNTLGIAGFTSAEAYKVGKSNPYVRLQRAFLRQTIDLGGAVSHVDGAANQLAGHQSANRIVLTIGKFSVGDVFDTNTYAHDPRNDFLNWTAVDTGNFDYAADAWGYSYGAAGEWYQGAWTLRAGLFNLSKVPNAETLETDLSQNEAVVEGEHRHTLWGHAGAIRVSVFRNHGRFVHLTDALDAAAANGGVMPTDLAYLRRVSNRWGFTVNLEQEVADDLGVFLRAGDTNGSMETYDFTDVDRTVAFGASLKGGRWGRKNDTVGLAFIDNGISRLRQEYLAAGGLGILVGDGQLPHPGDEHIAEAYYNWQAMKGVNLTIDYQFVGNPGYNRDRGPVNVLGARLHLAI